MFDIPVVLFLYKRSEKILQIIDVLRRVKPQKVYLLADGPRNENEQSLCDETRKNVLSAIDWDCEIVKKFHDENVGVFENIGLGAKNVLSNERWAIFIEDDNLIEESFLYYCKEMLEKYENEEKILWICGTNYLREFDDQYPYDVYFTKHMLPCGWASWGNKFPKYYDAHFDLTNDKQICKKVKKSYRLARLYSQRIRSIGREKIRHNRNKRYSSWDFQMIFTIRGNDLYGIVPKRNLVRNIGVDVNSVHSTKKDKQNNLLFCEVPSYPINLPIKTPEKIEINADFEDKLGKIIRQPLYIWLLFPVKKIIRKILRMSPYNK